MAHTDAHGAPDAHGVVNHETTDANLQSADWIIVFVAAFLAITFVFIWFLYGQLKNREVRNDAPRPAMAVRAGDRVPPTPRLQSNSALDPSRRWLTPSDDLAAYRKAEDQVLHGYGWVDKQQGLVKIPIERAIDLVAERGLPPLPPAPPASATTGATVTEGKK